MMIIFLTVLILMSSMVHAEPAVNLTATPAIVPVGGSVNLEWATKDVTGCHANGGWSGKKELSGAEVITNIQRDTEFGLDCELSNTVKVAVSGQPPPKPGKPLVGVVPTPHLGTFDIQGKAFVKELGVNSIRIGFSHGDHAGAINWAAENKVVVTLMLGYGVGCDPRTEGGRQCYADRSAGLVKQFGDKVKYWEVWNEWDGGFGLGENWKGPTASNGGIYTDLLCRTYKAVKAVKPSAIVAGGVMAGANEKFFDSIMMAGAGKCMDMFSQHVYIYRNMPGSVPSAAAPSEAAKGFISFVKKRRDLIKKISGKDMQILVTEAGYNSKEEEKVAGFVRELYGQTKAVPYIEGIWWYQLEDTGKGTFGLVRSNNTKKPAFDAFKGIAQ